MLLCCKNHSFGNNKYIHNVEFTCIHYFLGSLCDNTIRSHYAKFNHLDLAMLRDNSNISSLSEEEMLSLKEPEPEPSSPKASQSQFPKFKFKKSAAKVVSSGESRDTDNNSNDKNSSDSFKSAEENVITDKEPNVESVMRLVLMMKQGLHHVFESCGRGS